MNPLRIALADDHPVVLNGLVQMLAAEPELTVVGQFTQGKALRNWLAENPAPDVLVLDLDLGGEDGAALCGEFRQAYPAMQVLILTGFSQPSMVRAAMRQGAKGYVLKNAAYADLLEGIRSVAEGEEYLHAPIRDALLAEALQRPAETSFLPRLTRRELDVLRLIVDEKTTQEIADALFVSVNTIETHRANLIQKLGVRNVAGLVKIALEKGLLG